MPFTFVNSGVTGPKFTEFKHNVAMSSRMNFKKSEWRYCNPLRNARATNKGESRPWQRLLDNREKKARFIMYDLPTMVKKI